MMFSSKQLLEEMPLFLTHEYDKRLLLYGNLIQWTELEKLINNRPFMSNKRFQCTPMQQQIHNNCRSIQ